jgi:hypothetical protein
MPEAVRLPPHVGEDEVRVYWDSTDEGTCLHVWGPRGVSRLVLEHLASERPTFKGEFGDNFRARAAGLLVNEPSFADELDKLGYDPKTLVFSIRKKGAAAAPAMAPDDLLARLEAVETALGKVMRTVEGLTVCKGVYVMDDDERDALSDELASALEAVESAVDGVGAAKAP